MKVSLAMTTYKGIKYIEKQLDSLRLQTYPLDEVSICDDGSDDGTVEFARDYISKYNLQQWFVYQNRKNLGFAENFKQAIRLTSGDVIFLADQDDEWKSDKIARMMSVYASHAEIKALACNLSFINEHSQAFIPEHVPTWYNNMQSQGTLVPVDFMAICTTNFAPGCVMSFRREIADLYLNLKYPYSIHHDWLLAMLAAKDNAYYFLNEKLIDYRIHSSNAIGVTSAKKSQTADEQIERLKKMNAKYALAIDSDYLNKAQVVTNSRYIEARISFYEKRSLSSYWELIWKSIGAKGMNKNVLLMDGKDFLYFLHLVF